MKRHAFIVMLLGLGLFLAPLAHADISVTEAAAVQAESELEMGDYLEIHASRVFGWNLFQGHFSKVREPWFNPGYRLHIGDMVSVRIWGAVELAVDVPVDSQGNIFLPKVGNIPVLGVKNDRLISTIQQSVKRVYLNKVQVYANVANYQPITVFVTGNVIKPGLYQGMSSDSVLQFLDKARGISPDFGSYRDIEIIRNNEVVKSLDLYAFLTSGTLDLFQFKSGDIISVGNVETRITVTGDVKKPYRFEFSEKRVTLAHVLDLALVNPTATNVTITRWERDNKKIMETYPLNHKGEVLLQRGDVVDVFSDHVNKLNIITIAGEHDGLHTLLVHRDTNLGEVLETLTLTPRSEVASLQLFRKSVAAAQKQLLEAKLRKLEELILTTPSVTKEESLMRTQESKGILAFIDRARKIQPKGQIVINKMTDLNDIFLEDDDLIYIPTRSNLVLVQGEVSFPGAHTYVASQKANDYIALAGDLTDRADIKNILVLHQNGRVVKCDSKKKLKKLGVNRGDSLLVLPKMDGKNLQITAVLTQILYQLAISAHVLLTL